MCRIFGALLLLISLSLLFTSQAMAQGENYTLRFPQGLSGSSGEEISLMALLDILEGADPLGGWSLGVCHDFNLVQPISATTGATCEVAKNGAPVDFNEINFYGGDAADSGGVSQGVVICFVSCAMLPPGLDYEILNIDYALVGPNGTTATISYCDNAGIPNQPPPAVVVVPGTTGLSLFPTQEDTIIDIDVVPFELSFAPIAAVPQGEVASVPILMTNSLDVYGFSMGVLHDGSSLTATSVDQGAALQALNGGAGAGFFFADLAPSGVTGITVGTIMSPMAGGSVSVLPVGTEQEVLVASYDVSASATVGLTPLSFTSELSPPAPAPPVAIAISIGDSSVLPIVIDGSFEIESGVTGGVFVRGDVNGSLTIDLSDPIFLLNYLFTMGPEPGCLDTADVNDSGGVDLSDPITLLNYLFTMGPEPAAPFPDCGSDPSGDTDGVSCVTSSVCP